LRAFADGYVAVLLPAHLLALGFGTCQVDVLSSATLLGSAVATLAVGAWGHRFSQRGAVVKLAALFSMGAFVGGPAFQAVVLMRCEHSPGSAALGG